MKEGEFLTREEDLAGFWDLVSIQIDDIKSMFVKLDTLRSGGWKLETPPVRQAKPISTRKTPSQAKSTTASTTPSAATNGLKQTAASRARAEAAKQRLLEAKKAAIAAKQKETIVEAAPSEN